MNAIDWLNAHQNVIVRWAGVGCPAGTDVAWISEADTDFGFDLSRIDGHEEDGRFVADDCGGETDALGNTVQAVWLREDAAVWQAQYDEWCDAV